MNFVPMLLAEPDALRLDFFITKRIKYTIIPSIITRSRDIGNGNIYIMLI